MIEIELIEIIGLSIIVGLMVLSLFITEVCTMLIED